VWWEMAIGMASAGRWLRLESKRNGSRERGEKVSMDTQHTQLDGNWQLMIDKQSDRSWP